jgi:diadenylate cyclase
VHLVPNPNVPTSETGTRHRTAERVARSIDVPVLSVSEDMSTIAVYVGATKRVLEDSARLVARANQGLATLERYKARLDEVTGALNALEVEDMVSARDVAAVLQRSEMVRRIADEIDLTLLELGVDGRLLRLQLDELTHDLEDERWSIIHDYASGSDEGEVDDALAEMADLGNDTLLDARAVLAVLHRIGVDLDQGVQPRGYRILSRLPKLPESVVDELIEQFGSLDKIMRATHDSLEQVHGVDAERARAIKEGLARLTESSILEQYR